MIEYGYGYDDRSSDERHLDFMEELHHHYNERSSSKELLDELLADYDYIKTNSY